MTIDDEDIRPASTTPSDDLVEQRTLQLQFEAEERKLAEERLRESEARFRAMLDNTTSLVCLRDLEGRFLYINRQFRDLFGINEEQAAAMTDADLFPEETVNRLHANDAAALESENALEFEEILPHDQGPRTYISVRFPLRHATGEVYAVCSVSTDITDRKESELALARKSEELQRSNADLQQFAYVASHDLQEPLRMVTSYLQLLSRNYADKLDDEAREFIGFAVGGAKRMSALIRDLLEFSRVETQGKAFERLSMRAILDHALEHLQATILESDAQLTVANQLPVLSVDGPQMASVFQNLIGNAIKYRHPDRRPEVRIGVEKGNGERVFSVSDNGIGVSPEYHDRIFKIFQRLHSLGAYDGTGIGLAVVKRIIERHDGRIWMESDGKTGCTFFFALPENPVTLRVRRRGPAQD